MKEEQSTAPLIYAAMQAVMKEIGHVGKDKKNPQQGFKFRGIDDVMNALHGPLSRHGVFITSEILNEKRSERSTKNGGTLFYTVLRVAYTFHALDGSYVETMVEGEAMDSADKSTSKALSIAFKYAMMQVFSIPTEEQDDPDADTHDVAGEPPEKEKKADWESTTKAVKNHAPGAAQKLSPIQQVSAAISRYSRDRDLVGQWIRAVHPTVQFPQMTQSLADKVIQKIIDTPDEGFAMELKEIRAGR